MKKLFCLFSDNFVDIFNLFVLNLNMCNIKNIYDQKNYRFECYRWDENSKIYQLSQE